MEGFLRSCRWTAPGAVGHPSTLLASPPAPPHVRCALPIPLPHDIIHRLQAAVLEPALSAGPSCGGSLCALLLPSQRRSGGVPPDMHRRSVIRRWRERKLCRLGCWWLLASPTHPPIATTMVRHSHRRSPPRRPLTRVFPCGALHCGASGSGGVSCRRGKGVDRTWACWPRSRLAQHHLAPAG